MTIQYYIFMLVNGLSQGMLLFIIASGLTLVFGVLRVINFAHGSLYMIGAFLAFSLSTLLSWRLSHKLSNVAALCSPGDRGGRLFSRDFVVPTCVPGGAPFATSAHLRPGPDS